MTAPQYNKADYPIVLFDSECLICDGFVRIIIRWDQRKNLKFSSLQSMKAIHEIQKRRIPMPSAGTVVLLYPDTYKIESDAVIDVLDLMGFPSFATQIFRNIPQSWRDAMYRWVAQNRYRVFPKRKSCPLPKPSEAWRFV